MRKIIQVIIVFLILIQTSFLVAQEGSKYYEERLRPYKNVPINGNGSSSFLSLRAGSLQEENIGSAPRFMADMRTGGFLDLDYLGIYAEIFVRTSGNGLESINTYKRNNGFDDVNMISWFMTDDTNAIFPNKIYPENFYILIRDLSPFIPEIRIGKIWNDINAYSLYRTWGLEGIQFKQNLPFYLVFPFWNHFKTELSYDIIFSYNKVKDLLVPTDIHKYDRVLLSGHYTARSADLGFQFEFIHLFYNVSKLTNPDDQWISFRDASLAKEESLLRKDNSYSFILSQKLPYFFSINGLVVLEDHYEFKQNDFFLDQYVGRYGLANYNGVLAFGVGYKVASPYFMPVDPLTWTKYPPFNSDGYSWNYEEERGNLANEEAYFIWIEKFILGIRMNLKYEKSKYMNENLLAPGRSISPPGNKVRLSLFYRLFGMEIYNRFAYNNGYVKNPDNSITLQSMRQMELEMYYPLSSNFSLDIKADMDQKITLDNNVNYVTAVMLMADYKINSFISLKVEGKFTNPESTEPSWMANMKDYIDQTSWSVDNFAKIFIELNF